ncbi:MAG: 2,3-bisphosphoglycerate-independent phosphoglycerate mutase [Planctomycetota bacterium]
MTTPTTNTPCVLIVRDGWGENPLPEHDAFNAVRLADTPVADRLMETYPTTLIHTSGEDVGLPIGTMGNSEVGHQNIGAGRIVDQDAVRISKACREGRLREIDALRAPIERARDNGSAVHLMVLNSDAGVHALLTHLFAMLQLCKELGCERVRIHLFGDGRDTGPFTGKGYAEQVEAQCAAIGVGRVVSVVGRYWAMDRDNRWERVARTYRLLTARPRIEAVRTCVSAPEAFQAYYDAPTSDSMTGDEFVEPTAIGRDEQDVAATRISDGDTVLFVNYRGDRPRELCSAFLLDDFEGADEVTPSPDSGARGFDRGTKLDLNFVCMTPYSERIAQLAKVAFPKPPRMTRILGAYLSDLGLTQFRCAETEKYPHVTFFFNDYRDEPFEGERRENPASPRVATYDEQPEMSARAVADAVLARLDAVDCEDVIIVNFANGDMVGHTGKLDAAIKACETVDALVGEVVEKTLARGGSLVVTADHGNAEQMFSPDSDAPHTAHTTFDVPLIVVGDAFKGRTLRDGGRLADIAPTMLGMMGLDKPSEMTGESLLA